MPTKHDHLSLRSVVIRRYGWDHPTSTPVLMVYGCWDPRRALLGTIEWNKPSAQYTFTTHPTAMIMEATLLEDLSSFLRSMTASHGLTEFADAQSVPDLGQPA